MLRRKEDVKGEGKEKDDIRDVVKGKGKWQGRGWE